MKEIAISEVYGKKWKFSIRITTEKDSVTEVNMTFTYSQTEKQQSTLLSTFSQCKTKNLSFAKHV